MVKAVCTPRAAVLHSHPSLKHPWLDAWRRSMCKWRSWLGHCNFWVAFTQAGSSCTARSGCCPGALLWTHCAFLLQCQPISDCMSAFLLPVVRIRFLLLLFVSFSEHLGKVRMGQTVLFERCRNWGTFPGFFPSLWSSTCDLGSLGACTLARICAQCISFEAAETLSVWACGILEGQISTSCSVCFY